MRRALIILAITQFLVLGVTISLYRGERQKRFTTQGNLTASLSELETYKTREGELVSKVKGYEFKVKEFEQLIPQLKDQVSRLQVKLKNAQSVTEVVTEIKYVHRDRIVPVRENDTTKLYKVESEWINAHFRITNDSYVRAGDFVIDSIPNSTLLVPEVMYRGWWLWKRAVGIDVHIKHSNPYVSTTGATYINLRARR